MRKLSRAWPILVRPFCARFLPAFLNFGAEEGQLIVLEHSKVVLRLCDMIDTDSPIQQLAAVSCLGELLGYPTKDPAIRSPSAPVGKYINNTLSCTGKACRQAALELNLVDNLLTLLTDSEQ